MAKSPERGEERQQRSADDARRRGRQGDVEERLPRTAVEILPGVDQLGVEIAQRRVDGKDREWQIAVDESRDHSDGARYEILPPDSDVHEERC